MKPDEFRRLLEELLPAALYPQWYVSMLALAMVALVALAGGFLGAYLKRRGENYATRADFDRLLEQVTLQTKATEEIKAQVSGDAWVLQRRWDFMRETYSELITALSVLVDSTATVIGLLDRLEAAAAPAEQRGLQDLIGEFEGRRSRTVRRVRRLISVGAVILPEAPRRALEAMLVAWKGAGEVTHRREFLEHLCGVVGKAHDLVIDAARKDLGVLPRVE